MSFVGRRRELAELERLLAEVQKGTRADRGVALLLRGRRRVGKSRLVTRFVERAGVPHVYFQAARYAPPQQELNALMQATAVSTLPDGNWPDVREVGGWWPRNNTPEIDLVGADSRPATAIIFVGTVKLRRDSSLTARDARALAADAPAVPGVGPETPLVGVCADAHETNAGFAQVWTAEDLLAAWPD